MLSFSVALKKVAAGLSHMPLYTRTMMSLSDAGILIACSKLANLPSLTALRKMPLGSRLPVLGLSPSVHENVVGLFL